MEKRKNIVSVLIKLIRPKHWSKNSIIFLGILLAVVWTRSWDQHAPIETIIRGAIVFFSSCLVSSANYILNDIFDLKWDMKHPIKKERQLSQVYFSKTFLISLMVGLWITGIAVGWIVDWKIGLAIFILMLSAWVYNIPPVRAKDIPFLDVIVESFNNPLRFMMGWYVITPIFFQMPVLLDLLLLLWVYSCFLMTAKRFAEYMFLGRKTAVTYRKVFRAYSIKRFNAAVITYMVASVLMFMFIVHTANLLFHIVTLMLVIQLMWYYNMIHTRKEIVQKPVEIYKARAFTAYSLLMALVFVAILLITYL